MHRNPRIELDDALLDLYASRKHESGFKRFKPAGEKSKERAPSDTPDSQKSRKREIGANSKFENVVLEGNKRKLKMKQKAGEFLFVSDDDQKYLQEPQVIFW